VPVFKPAGEDPVFLFYFILFLANFRNLATKKKVAGESNKGIF
jgi:hypothetical protein